MAELDETAFDAMNLLRSMQQTHVALSQMADIKANILIGTASVVVALVATASGPANASPAMLILGAASAIAVALCVWSVIPSTAKPRHVADPNLLFFGAFGDMAEADFQARMADLLISDAAIHRAMIRDIYQLGCVLRRKKYRYLAYAYRTFLIGLGLAVLAYVLEQMQI